MVALVLGVFSCEIPSLSLQWEPGPCSWGVTVQVPFLGGRLSAPQLVIVLYPPCYCPSVCSRVCLGLKPARCMCSIMAEQGRCRVLSRALQR